MESKIRFPNKNKNAVNEPPVIVQRAKEIKKAKKELQRAKEKECVSKRQLIKGSIKEAEIAELKKKALALRARHYDYTEIGKALGVSPTTAGRLVKQALLEVPEESANQVKKMLNLILDRLLKVHDEFAIEGSSKSAEIVLKAIDKVMKLSGLDIVREQVETSNLGNVPVGNDFVDITKLDLPVDVKRQLLQAIRKYQEENPNNNNPDAELEDL